MLLLRQASPRFPFCKAAIGFKLGKTNFFCSGGIYSDPITLKKNQSFEEKAESSRGAELLPTYYFTCRSPAVILAFWLLLFAVLFCMSWLLRRSSVSEIQNICPAWQVSLCYHPGFVVLGEISCARGGSFTCLNSKWLWGYGVHCQDFDRGFQICLSPNSLVLIGVWAVLRGSLSWYLVELEYSCLSTKLSLSEEEKNVPSEGSKKNIENIINTHSCKISMAFFFFLLVLFLW